MPTGAREGFAAPADPGRPRRMLHFRHFTRDEANAMRPWVAERVDRLRGAREHLLTRDNAASVAAASALSGGSWPGRDHAQAALTYALTLEELEERDIVIRDVDRGLVDFPSLIDGREGYLCWLVDEPEVGRWHGLGAGYGGRHPLA